jgi:hypothetical protein
MTNFRFESAQALGARCMDVLMRNVGVLDTERFIAYLSRESADYTEWRQNQFDDLTIEELGHATRKSGKHIKSVLQADAAVASLRRKE